MASMDTSSPKPFDLDAVHTTRQFGAHLTARRERAGLSIRRIAEVVGVPRATVGDYCAGRALPSVAMTPVLLKILTVCGVFDPDEVEAWERALLRVRRLPGPVRSDSVTPYRGLESFGAEHADWFHGRGEVVSTAVGMIRDRAGGGVPLMVVGPSGAGKSSLLHAGVVPKLDWTFRATTPGRDPLGRLIATIAEGAENVDDLRAHVPERFLLVVDQFEELLSEESSAKDIRAYLEALRTIACVPGAAVVIGLRSDFYDHAVRHPLLASALRMPTVVVGPMTQDELRSVILEPARQARAEVEDGLVELLLRDFHPYDAGDAGALPLLSHALLATWITGGRRALTTAAYTATGGVAHAIERSAESVYLSLDDDQRRATKSMFLRLAHLGDSSRGARWTRRMVARDELPDSESAGLAKAVDRFVHARLVTADARTLQISHEALIHSWARLRNWLDEDHDGARVRRRAQAAATAWAESGRDPGVLYRGAQLAALQEWIATPEYAADMNAVERDFLDTALAAQRQEALDREKHVRTLRRWVGALVAVSVVAFGMTGVVVRLRADALTERNLAISRQTALRAVALGQTDPALAARLAVAAYRIADTPESRSALLDAAVTPAAGRTKVSSGTVAVAASTDGRLIATGAVDGSVRLWRHDNQRLEPVGEPVTVADGSLFAIALDPSARSLAAVGIDRRVHLFDLTDPADPVRLADPMPTLPGTGYALAFSPDGRFLAVAGQGGLHIRDRVTGTTAGPIGQDTADLTAVAFHPDGEVVVVGGPDHAPRLWSLRDPSAPLALATPDGWPGGANSVAFGPDGHTLALAGNDREVRLWELPDAGPPRPLGVPLGGFAGPVSAVGIAPDGRTVIAGGTDGTTRTWDLPSGRVRAVLPHAAPVTATTALPGGGHLLTAAADGYLRLWALPGRTIPGGRGAISTVAFAPDGQAVLVSSTGNDAEGLTGAVQRWDITDPTTPTAVGAAMAPPPGAARSTGVSALRPDGGLMAAGEADGTVRLWNLATPTAPVPVGPPLTGATGVIQTLVFTPDGRTLVAGGDDHRVRLWDVTLPEAPRLVGVLDEPRNIVLTAAVNPDGSLLATTNADNDIYVWDISVPSAPRFLQRLTGHTNYTYSAAFSPDGRTLAVGSADKTVSLWDVRDHATIHRVGRSLTGAGNYVYSVAYTPDSTRLAAASTDGAVRLWNVADPESPLLVATLRSTGPVFTISISGDGRTLAAGMADGSVRLWPLDPEAAITQVCASATTLEPEEWRTHVPDLPYQDPCDAAR